MKKFLLVLAGFVATSLFYVASAQDEPTPEQMAAGAATDRQAVFKLLRFNIGPILAMTQGAPFDCRLGRAQRPRIAPALP